MTVRTSTTADALRPYRDSWEALEASALDPDQRSIDPPLSALAQSEASGRLEDSGVETSGALAANHRVNRVTLSATLFLKSAID